MIALSVAGDGRRHRLRAQAAARSPARTRGRRTRSSGSRPRRRRRTTSTSIPRVRSVEPMKDIRREIEQRTSAEQRYRSGQPVAAVSRWKRRTQPSPVARRQAGRLRLLHADQAEGAAAAAPDDDHDDVRRRATRRSALVAITVIGGFLSAGGAGAFNHCYDRDIDAAMARTATPPGADRPDLAARGADLRVRAAGRVVRDPRDRREPAERVPRPGRVRLVHGRLHGLAQAPLAAEHRDRRRRRRRPAARRLGRGDGLVAPAALYLFAIVFYWTPPHFWALSAC